MIKNRYPKVETLILETVEKLQQPIKEAIAQFTLIKAKVRDVQEEQRRNLPSYDPPDSENPEVELNDNNIPDDENTKSILEHNTLEETNARIIMEKQCDWTF